MGEACGERRFRGRPAAGWQEEPDGKISTRMGEDAGEGRSRHRVRALHRRNLEAPVPSRSPPDNYPIDIVGKWRGSKYSFITRYRSGFPENLGEEFDSAFTRLDHVEEHLSDLRFHVMWHRHTGQWFRLHALVTLDEALRLMASEELLWPL